MEFSITGQERSDCLIEVTTWPGLTVFILIYEDLFITALQICCLSG